jgi:hypothetical protein
MCATLVWAVNAAADVDDVWHLTRTVLGVEPRPTAYRIDSPEVRPTARHFTVARHQCDCRALVGAGDDPPGPGEVPADSWLGWVRALPTAAPHLTRLSVLRAWSPDDAAAEAPVSMRRVPVADVDEATLRGVGDDALLVIDYPPTTPG